MAESNFQKMMRQAKAGLPGSNQPAAKAPAGPRTGGPAQKPVSDNKYNKQTLDELKSKYQEADDYAKNWTKGGVLRSYGSKRYNDAAKSSKAAYEDYQKGFDATQKFESADETTAMGRIRKSAGADVHDDKQMSDVLKGAQFGQDVLGPEGLGRISEEQNANMAEMQANAKELAKGYSSEQQLAMKEKGMTGIIGTSASQTRALQAALARTGVKGQAAGAQIGNVAQASVEARGNLERDLQIANFDAQLRGSNFQRGIESDATANNQFDINQATKEKKLLLASGMGYAGLGAVERGAKLNADAVSKAGNQGGGSDGTSFVCSALRRSGRMSPYETATMLAFMLWGVIRYSKFFAWYFKEASNLAENIERNSTNLQLNKIKQDTVTSVMEILEKGDKHTAAKKYIDEVVELAQEQGVEINTVLNKSSLLDTIVFLPRIFMLKSTWKWSYGLIKTKTIIKCKRLLKA